MTKAPETVILEDYLGRKIPIGAVKKLRVVLDKWGRKVKIYGELKSGINTVFMYKVEDLWKKFEE